MLERLLRDQWRMLRSIKLLLWKQALEDAILDILAQEQEHVSNEELRHYMNETIWFAAKQTVKNKASEEPTVQDEHVVDLREAINRPANQETKKVDLRAAINNK